MISKIINIILMIILCLILFIIGLLLGNNIHKAQYRNQPPCDPQKAVNNEIQIDEIN